MTTSGVSIRVWDGQDDALLPGLLESSAIAHGNARKPPEWFDWKYRQSPWGRATIAYAESPSGTVAGAVAFGSYQLVDNSSILRAGISYETFVHPAFRSAGLFGELRQAAEEDAWNRGFEIMFNFPNQASVRGFLRSGWVAQGGVESWIRPRLGLRGFSRLLRQPMQLRAFQPDASDRGRTTRLDHVLTPEHKPLPLAGGTHALRRAHSLAFLGWRTEELPNSRYALVEQDPMTALVRLGSRGGLREAQVLEIFSSAHPTRRHMTELLRTVLLASDTDMVSVVGTRESPSIRLLPRMGFVRVPNRITMCVKRKPPRAALAQDPSELPIAVSGLDIHTW